MAVPRRLFNFLGKGSFGSTAKFQLGEFPACVIQTLKLDALSVTELFKIICCDQGLIRDASGGADNTPPDNIARVMSFKFANLGLELKMSAYMTSLEDFLDIHGRYLVSSKLRFCCTRL